MNTNMTGFRYFSKLFAFHVLWTKVDSALEGLNKDFLFLLSLLVCMTVHEYAQYRVHNFCYL